MVRRWDATCIPRLICPRRLHAKFAIDQEYKERLAACTRTPSALQKFRNKSSGHVRNWGLAAVSRTLAPSPPIDAQAASSNLVSLRVVVQWHLTFGIHSADVSVEGLEMVSQFSYAIYAHVLTIIARQYHTFTANYDIGAPERVGPPIKRRRGESAAMWSAVCCRCTTYLLSLMYRVTAATRSDQRRAVSNH